MKKDPKSLSIRAKVVISVLVLTTILTLIFYLVATKIILKSYANVENDVVDINIRRVGVAVKNLENSQAVKLKDWAVWDDTYKFAKDLNKDYRDNNLQISSLVNLDINFIAFVDKDGKIIFNKVIDLKKEEELDIKPVNNVLEKYNLILKRDTNNGPISGVINTPYGIAIVSSGPILRSDGGGTSDGTLILGNFLNKDVTTKIGDSILYPVDIFDYNKEIQSDVVIAKTQLSTSNTRFIQVLSYNSVAGYSLLYDLDNKPLAITKITLPRNFYNKGLNTFNIFTIIICGMLLLFGLGIILLLERLIIRRFTVLSKEFSDISISKDLTKRVTVDKADEIGNLSYIINNIFKELYESQEKEKEAGRLEKIATEELRKHMEDTDKINKLMVNRELKMIELNKKVEEFEKNKNN